MALRVSGKALWGVGSAVSLGWVSAGIAALAGGLGWNGVPAVAALVAFLSLVAAALLALRFLWVPWKASQKETEAYLTGRLEPLVSGLTQIAMGNLTQTLGETGAAPATTDPFLKKIEEAARDYAGIVAEPLKRLCFVGNNAYQEGGLGARQVGSILGGRGTVAILLPRIDDLNHAFRVKGFLDVLRADFPGIRVVDQKENLRGGDMRANSRAIVTEWCRTFPDLDLIFITEGYTPVVCCEAIAAKPGKKPTIVTFDLWADNVKAMETGIVSVLLDQDFLGQGYLPLVHLYHHVDHRYRPLFPKLTQEPVIITPKNLHEYWDKASKTTKVPQAVLDKLPTPKPRASQTPIKLAFLIPERGNTWVGILVGAERAKKALAPLGVQVDIIDLKEQNFDLPFGAAGWYLPVLQKVSAQKYHGVALNVSDSALVPVLNGYSDRGLPVATFSAEPFNFREILQTIQEGVRSLTNHSQSLAAAASESSRSTTRIDSTMQSIVRDLDGQFQDVAKTDSLMQDLGRTIETMVSGVDQITGSIEEAARQAGLSHQAVHESARATGSLKDSYRLLQGQVTDLGRKFDDISRIVETIEGFANETNVLAINAAIQAARAGENGKGFSVVATSVRNLAENSRKATVEIKGIVDSARTSMEAAEDQVEGGTRKVMENLELAENAGQALTTLLGANEDASSRVKGMVDMIATVEAASAQVRSAMASLESVIRLNGQRIGEISGSTAEMSLQEQDLTNMAVALQSLAKDQEMLLTQLSFNRKG